MQLRVNSDEIYLLVREICTTVNCEVLNIMIVCIISRILPLRI